MYADCKVRENHVKITNSLEKLGKVRKFEKNYVPGQGKSGKNILVQIFEWGARNYSHLEI